ncbi:MAG: hypothetical protein H0U74_07995 [Bradymonadaceae bacterium]|nr:hypothetical protein [Lujinxingiaceae bacterium]
MTILREQARALCTDDEYVLYEASFGKPLEGLSLSELRENIARTRRARDKFRDLAKRQRLEQRGKKEPSGQTPAQGNDRSEQKVTLFQQTLDRFATRLESLEPGATDGLDEVSD